MLCEKKPGDLPTFSHRLLLYFFPLAIFSYMCSLAMGYSAAPPHPGQHVVSSKVSLKKKCVCCFRLQLMTIYRPERENLEASPTTPSQSDGELDDPLPSELMLGVTDATSRREFQFRVKKRRQNVHNLLYPNEWHPVSTRSNLEQMILSKGNENPVIELKEGKKDVRKCGKWHPSEVPTREGKPQLL